MGTGPVAISIATVVIMGLNTLLMSAAVLGAAILYKRRNNTITSDLHFNLPIDPYVSLLTPLKYPHVEIMSHLQVWSSE